MFLRDAYFNRGKKLFISEEELFLSGKADLNWEVVQLK